MFSAIERLRDLAREAARVPRAGLLRQSQRVRRALALTALIVLVPAGCGGGGTQQRDTSAAAAIDLTLTLWPNGEAGDSVTWTLQCEPTGGDHPRPRGGVCRR